MVKRFWLSYADFEQPEGKQLLGVCVVEVYDEDVEFAREKIRERWPGRETSEAALYGGAALYVAWRDACNPGGEVAVVPMPDHVWKRMAASGVRPSRMFTAEQLAQWAVAKLDADEMEKAPADETPS